MEIANERVPVDVATELVDPAAYSDQERIDKALAWLRKFNPMAKVEAEGFSPFWAVTKHADILQISRQNDAFQNGELSLTLVSKEDDQKIRAAGGGKPYLARALVQMDPPDHPKYRQLTHEWFLPQNLKTIEQDVRRLAKDAVAEILDKDGRCDFVRDVAVGYPLRVIMSILGVPAEDEPLMLRLTQAIFAPEDPEFDLEGAVDDPTVSGRLHQIYGRFGDYFSQLARERRTCPRQDLATVIANSVVDDAPIADFEAISYYTIVATAGHDTTTASIAGAVWALCENPGEFNKVLNNPDLIPGMINEAIRWTTPVKHFMRSASKDVQIRGRTIRAGDWLMLCYLSGNRDEEVFHEPDKFKVDRRPNRHVAFGNGPHICLGQHLAKLEMRTFFEELLPHVRAVRLTGEPRRTASSFVTGPKELPVEFSLR